MDLKKNRWSAEAQTKTSALWVYTLLAAIILVLFNPDTVHGENTSQSCPANKFVSAERKLIHCLLDGYDTAVRPVKNVSEVLQITVSLFLVKIVELNEQEHVLETTVWIHKTWKDDSLKWDPKLYDNVTSLRLPIEKIWRPDLVLYNNAGVGEGFVVNKLAVVSNKGQVVWVPTTRFRSFCNLALRSFPFDTQTCVMSFGSWSHDLSKIDIKLPKQHVEKRIYDGKEWRVLHMTTARSVVSYSDNESYPVITWTIQMKRAGSFYTWMLVAPSVVLSILVIFVFLVPPASGERLPFAVGVLLAQILMLLLLADYIPTEISDFPAIGIHLLLQIMMMSGSMIISTGILNCYHRGSRKNKVPSWLRKLCLGRLGRLFCLKPDMYTTIPSDLSTLDHGASELRTVDELGLDSPGPKNNTMEATLEDIRKYLRICAARAAENHQPPGFSSHRDLVINEWHEVAMVIDRLMALLYAALTLLIFVFMFSHS